MGSLVDELLPVAPDLEGAQLSGDDQLVQADRDARLARGAGRRAFRR